ncbi:MAG TPA: hypothetical protein VLJ86_20780 [Ramlibacter sp.]|nr:hypothetical protein [Ramlibacter sp.]
MTSNSESFEAIWLRTRLLDVHGNEVNENTDDSDAWALADALREAGAPLDVLVMGRCHITVLSGDDSAIASLMLLDEHMDGEVFIRARLAIDQPAASAPAGGDLIAVVVATGKALIYEVLLHADELPPIEPGATALVTLPPGEAVLQLRSDLGLIEVGMHVAEALPVDVEVQHA